jgi:hypothetical protein
MSPGNRGTVSRRDEPKHFDQHLGPRVRTTIHLILLIHLIKTFLMFIRPIR